MEGKSSIDCRRRAEYNRDMKPIRTRMHPGVAVIPPLLVLLTALAVGPAPSAQERKEKEFSAAYEDGALSVTAVNIPFGMLLKAINYNTPVKISGLGHRENELITFSGKGSAEAVLKRLLKQLDEKNYAFRFDDERLTAVSVFQETTADVVRILGVLEGTQAEELGLRPDDLILEYGGLRVRSAQELIAEVDRRSEAEQVDMLIVREERPMRLKPEGGFIGIEIETYAADKNLVKKYLSQPR